MLCFKCKKRQAILFVTRIENGKQTQEGYCMKCARELNIGPINQIMEKMGVSDEDIDMISDQVTDLLTDEDGNFEYGGAPTFPFMGNADGIESFSDDGIKKPGAKKEMKELDKYDYALLNDNLQEAIAKMAGIISAEQCRVERQDKKIKLLK